MITRDRSLLFRVLLVLAAALPLSSTAKEEPKALRAVVYSVWHGDSLHAMGGHVPEVFVPDLGIAFHLAFGRLQVFRVEDPGARYGTKKSMTLELSEVDGTKKTVDVPILHMPGQEPRRLREIEMAPEDVRKLQEFFALQERVTGIARKYAR